MLFVGSRSLMWCAVVSWSVVVVVVVVVVLGSLVPFGIRSCCR